MEYSGVERGSNRVGFGLGMGLDRVRFGGWGGLRMRVEDWVRIFGGAEEAGDVSDCLA